MADECQGASGAKKEVEGRRCGVLKIPKAGEPYNDNSNMRSTLDRGESRAKRKTKTKREDLPHVFRAALKLSTRGSKAQSAQYFDAGAS